MLRKLKVMLEHSRRYETSYYWSDTFLRRKGKRGKYYMGIKTNDSGFKKVLKGGSPQVEHAFTGIYFSKGPGMASRCNWFLEVGS